MIKAVIGWQSGGLAQINWKMLGIIAPFIILGLLVAQLFARQLTILSLDETVAKALGQQTFAMTMTFLAIVVILSAAAVALVGSIAFCRAYHSSFYQNVCGEKIIGLSFL